MPVISFGAECSGFLKAANQAQQSARQLAASALEAQRAVQGLGEGNYSRFISESDKAARAVGGVQSSTTRAASGASGALEELARMAVAVRDALQQMSVKDPGLQELAEFADGVSIQLAAMGEQAKDAEKAMANMTSTSNQGARKAAGSLEAYALKIGETTIKSQNLSDSLAAGYYDLDRSMGRCFENLLSGAEMSFTGVRNAFMGMLADITNQAVTRPITLSITGAMGGMFGGGGIATGTAQAAGGGASFGIPNIPMSSLLPESWTSGISGFLGTTLPGTYSSSVGLTAGSLSTSALQNAGSLPAAGSFAGSAGGFGLGSALTYGGLGGLGYSLLGGALGLPQNKWSSLSASAGGALGAWGGSALGAAMGSSGAISGALAGSAMFPVVGTILGALGGGLLSGVFGGKKPKRPAVWGGMELNLGQDLPGYEFSSVFDSKGYGRDSFAVHENANYAVASRSRNKASGELAGTLSNMLNEVAALGLQQAGAVQEALPDAYAAAFKNQLAQHQVSGSWDLKGDDITEENFKGIVEDVQNKINDSMLSAFKGMDFSEYAGKINVDQSAIEGLNKFTQAIKLTEEAIAATAAINDPLSEMEQQAKAVKAQLAEWSKAMQAAGVTTEYAGQLLGDYNTTMIGKFIGDMETSLNPLSQYAQAQKDANKAVDDRLAALKILGATETQLAQVEGLRSQVLEAALSPMRLAFEQDARIREAQLVGNEALLSSVQLAVQHERELADIRTKFGADSAEYARVLNLQGQELLQLSERLEAQRAGFAQDLQIRQAQLSGDSDLIASIQMTIQHERELADIRAKFGAESVQAARMQAMQIAETAQLAWQQQQAAAQKLLQEQAQAAQDALNKVNAALSSAQSELNAARNAYLSALNKEASGLKATVDAVTRAVGQLSRTRMDLLAGADSPLGVDQRYSLVGAELERVYAKAMGGDADAMAELATLSSKYLDVSKEANADFAKYRKDFERVQAMLAAVETSGLSQVDTAQKQLDLLNAQIAAATEGTAQIVGSIKELEAAFLKAMGDYNAAQEAARKAQEAADEARRKAEEAANNAANSQKPKTWMQDVLERKSADLNLEATLPGSQMPSGWTPEKVLQTILQYYDSFADWYAASGKAEGYAKGGLAAPGWAIVGEEGPELVNFSQPGRVYTATETAEMLNPSAEFRADSFFMPAPMPMSSGNANSELIQEIKALRREVAELRAEQSRSQFRIADAAQRTARKLEQFDYDGLPSIREQ